MIEFIIGSSLAAAAGLDAWMPLFLLVLTGILLLGLVVAILVLRRRRQRRGRRGNAQPGTDVQT